MYGALIAHSDPVIGGEHGHPSYVRSRAEMERDALYKRELNVCRCGRGLEVGPIWAHGGARVVIGLRAEAAARLRRILLDRRRLLHRHRLLLRRRLLLQESRVRVRVRV